jgi:hypothetical protein
MHGFHHSVETGPNSRRFGIAFGKCSETFRSAGQLPGILTRAPPSMWDLLGEVLRLWLSGKGAHRDRGHGMPRAWQNLAVAESAVPQFEQVRASGVAHSSQNRAPCGFSCWHRGHFMPGLQSTDRGVWAGRH